MDSNKTKEITSSMEAETEEDQFTQKSEEQCKIDDGGKMTEDSLFECAETSDNATTTTKFKPRCGYFEYNTNMSFRFESSLQKSTEDWFKYCNENGLVADKFYLEDLNFESRNAVELIANTRTNQPNSDTLSDIHQLQSEEHLKGLDMFSEEQKDFVKFIHDQIKSMSHLNDSINKCILLTGYAGTGKTSTLEGICDIENSSVLYVAYTKSLCAGASAKFKLTAMNYCQFLMKAKSLSADVARRLMNEMQENRYYDVIQPISRDFFNEIIPQKDIVGIIFLDEFSMFSPQALKRFVKILETASKELSGKFLIILCGDFMHIPPMYRASMDYEPIIKKCEKIFNFQKQLRVTDVNYLNTIMKLKTDPLLPASEFWKELKRVIPENCFSPLIEYTFPFEYIEEAYLRLGTSSDPYSWLSGLAEDFFAKVLTLKSFAFGNSEVHYMNLHLAFTIINQLTKQGKHFESIGSFVCFAKFLDITHEKPINPMRIPILPLIRFFPYRILVNSSYVCNESVVYLIDWDLNERHVIVYYPHDKQIFKVSPTFFYMSLFQSQHIFGIPLELAFASTFHKAQGQTFTEDIAVSLSDIDYRELFAILLRIRSARQIKNLCN